MSSLPKEALDEYIGETREMCERVSVNLGMVEKNQHEDETLNSIYRDMHSIKGSSHLFGFRKIGELAHALETALDPIRQKTLKMNPDIVDVLYAGLDLMAKMLEGIIAQGEEGDANIAALSEIMPRIVAIKVDSVQDDAHALIEKTIHSHEKIESSLKDEHAAEAGTLRIQVGVLDHLMSLIGELVLVRNQVLQYSNKGAATDFQKLAQRLNVVTSEIQNDVMKTRMQPVGNILSKFQRLVRDTSRELGKKIELKIEGSETELDKTIIEAVKDPLTHLIRNSIDHGIEKPEDRRNAGKAETGLLTIRSFHEGGQVIIEISDDGRGLSKLRIGRKSVEKGVVSEEQLERMTEREVQSLIFVPGFSTVEKVSNISGRGVGMDVVKTNIERIGGSIDLQSNVGVGTTVRLKIPLTLAIVPAIIVNCEGHSFAIPQVKVVELVRVDQGKKGAGLIEMLQGRPVYRLRGQLLPLVDLSGLLGIAEDKPFKPKDLPVANIVVLRGESGVYGLIVKDIVDSADIVVKPMSKILKSLRVYSGATIMGDGSVILILDVAGLSVKASSVGASMGNVKEEKSRDASLKNSQGHSSLDMSEYLLVNIGQTGQYVIPLCIVNRLEEFDANAIQRSGDQDVVKYGSGILPLIDVAKHLNLPVQATAAKQVSDKIQVIVLSKMNRLFGMRVQSVMDVVQIESNIDIQLSDRPGIMGSLIQGKNLIVVLDAHKIIDMEVRKISGANVAELTAVSLRKSRTPVAVPATSGVGVRASRSRHKILLAEDTIFFRRHVTNFLESSGFRVTAVLNGDEALRSLNAIDGKEFSLVITDIEMPVMDGFELTTKIRASRSLADLPVLALSTRFRKVDIDRGVEVGVTAYLDKFNGDLLLENIDRILGLTGQL
jgi:two-component system chemotaxis sensor kinase CheA